MATDLARTDRVSTGDRFAIWFFIVVGALLAAWSVVFAIARIVAVLPNRDVEVPAVFSGTIAQAPIGPGGAAVPVELNEAILTAPQLPVASLVALVVQQVVAAATITTVVVCLLVLAWSILRDRVFSRRNTRLVTVTGLVGVVGYAGTAFFGNMAANGAFAVLSDGSFDNIVMTVDLLPYLLAAFVAALASTIFGLGARLQRETEGLV